MALLDELKKEAERIRIQGNEVKTQEEQRRIFYEEYTKPALQRLYVYLNDLKEQLSVINPNIAASYDIPGIGNVDTLTQNFVVQIDSSNNPKKVGFICTAIATEPREGTIQSEKLADGAREVFNSIKQQFSEWPVRGLSGNIAGVRFAFKLSVPITVHFIADLPNEAIQMVTNNMEGFRVFKHRMQPLKIDDAWMDRLGLYLLRRGPDPSLTILTEEEKDRLRRHLRATQERYY